MGIDDINMVYGLKTFAAKFCNVQDVEDIVQDAFVKILNNPRFDDLGEADKKRYAVWVIKNLIIDRYRRRKAEKNGGGKKALEFHESLVGRKPDVYGKIELKEAIKKGREHRFYPELILSAEGYKCMEIAGMVGESLNCVLGRIRYARVFIKKAT